MEWKKIASMEYGKIVFLSATYALLLGEKRASSAIDKLKRIL